MHLRQPIELKIRLKHLAAYLNFIFLMKFKRLYIYILH